MPSILTSTHPDFRKAQAKRDLVSTVYTGDGIENKLTRRSQGETSKEFKERRQVAQYENYFAHIQDAHAGVLFQHEPPRDFGLLGDEGQRGTVAHQLTHDANGKGTDYSKLIRQAANELLLKGEVYCLVDGLDDYGQAPIHIIEPDDVVNWNDDRTKLKIRRDKKNTGFPDSLSDVTDEYYTVYDTTGWENLKETEGMPPESRGKNPYSRNYTSPSGRPIPPVVHVQLEVPRYITYNLAKSAISIYENESVRDWALRTSGFGLLQLAAENQEKAEELLGGIKDGNKVLWVDPTHSQGHEYKSPSFDGTEARREVITEKIERFYRVAFRKYQQKGQLYTSAAEVGSHKQENTSAYLSLVAGALEELENDVLWLLEQTHYPNRTPEAKVEWPRRMQMPDVRVMQGKEQDFQEDNENESTEQQQTAETQDS